ncbi:hypothetical protein [Pseudomonas sp. Irchel 3F5]|uniref:hypothetical protein n=1 Tax=Pseudomonas sp. Irchel 3F5 TaxID=2009002 RepID=UPI000BA4D5A0|nr:hypothetical protein [Pseudomonas sp. Irchel 3F5]
MGLPSDWLLPSDEFEEVKRALKSRCEAVGVALTETDYEGESVISLSFRCGRETRDLEYIDQNNLPPLLSIPFEKYSFLAGLDAICNYGEGSVEVLISPASAPPIQMFNNLFGVSWRDAVDKLEPIVIEKDNRASIEIGLASQEFRIINPSTGPRAVTLKLYGVTCKGHDTVLEFLNKIAGSVLFQIELASGVALIMKRNRVRRRLQNASGFQGQLDIVYPEREFDEAPLSLYWYARSASGMPLLQYLAYYQVIEFYFPVYSRSEAHRKLKAILKNPIFRSDRDADISKLLTAIQVSRGGAFGDERVQLKATIEECIDEEELRVFLSLDEDRKNFLSSKSNLTSAKLSIAGDGSELRNEVARRIYELRCKIVHTKSDVRDNDVELLLPFSKEAELMHYDIELVQYVAQHVLIAGSRTLNL